VLSYLQAARRFEFRLFVDLGVAAQSCKVAPGSRFDDIYEAPRSVITLTNFFYPHYDIASFLRRISSTYLLAYAGNTLIDIICSYSVIAIPRQSFTTRLSCFRIVFTVVIQRIALHYIHITYLRIRKQATNRLEVKLQALHVTDKLFQDFRRPKFLNVAGACCWFVSGPFPTPA
jgi:hypothetical protein